MPESVEATETIRRRLLRWLSQGEYDFDALQEALELGVRDLERDLRHVERTVRRRGQRLRVSAPRCSDCGFDFPGRTARHLHTPSRCPKCRGERIAPSRFSVAR
ncbi:MAG: transcriptional regulator [Myxococcales bacterium]|nr:transcriptional regulator [Myxococcales bacterium]MDH5305948.1 transcriptional regulator [Myxococcales bacterium]